MYPAPVSPSRGGTTLRSPTPAEPGHTNDRAIADAARALAGPTGDPVAAVGTILWRIVERLPAQTLAELLAQP